MVWATLMRVDPGAAVATWMEAHEGEAFETEGPNKGPRLRDLLLGGDGLPWCIDLPLSLALKMGAKPLPPFRAGAHGYWHNRSVDNCEKSMKRGGMWAGPLVPPARGMVAFMASRAGSDPGKGRHANIVTEYDAGERVVYMIGANIGDTIKRVQLRHGHPSITGLGVFVPGGAG